MTVKEVLFDLKFYEEQYRKQSCNELATPEYRTEALYKFETIMMCIDKISVLNSCSNEYSSKVQLLTDFMNYLSKEHNHTMMNNEVKLLIDNFIKNGK